MPLSLCTSSQRTHNFPAYPSISVLAFVFCFIQPTSPPSPTQTVVQYLHITAAEITSLNTDRNSIRWSMFKVLPLILFPLYPMIQTACKLGHLYHPGQLWSSSRTLALSGPHLSLTWLSACRACQLTPDCGLTTASNSLHLDSFITVKKGLNTITLHISQKLKGALNERDLTSHATPHRFHLNTKSDNPDIELMLVAVIAVLCDAISTLVIITSLRNTDVKRTLWAH